MGRASGTRQCAAQLPISLSLVTTTLYITLSLPTTLDLGSPTHGFFNLRRCVVNNFSRESTGGCRGLNLLVRFAVLIELSYSVILQNRRSSQRTPIWYFNKNIWLLLD